MRQTISHITLVVRDYDEAIEYYSDMLGFVLIEDTALAPGKRWVVVKPKGTDGTALLLAKAATAAQFSRVGDQTGGRVFLFLRTDDFWRDYRNFVEKGVVFEEEPRKEPFGTVAVFRDLYGNRWDLIELAAARLP
ncbi:MAG: VOC family protein [Acidobacteria bacterium]|nr:MAG: VOC family protein [Acidobacteriota bacterium]